MGMWLIQEVARKLEHKFSFEEFAAMADREPPFQYLINVNDQRFLNPPDMVAALQNYCEETGQKVPLSPGQLARAIYDNLALCYAYELEQLARLTGKTLEVLHVVGGGSRNRFLNQLTADVAQTTVVAGPVEATALGNIMMQMIGKGELTDVDEARAVLRQSFPAETFIPRKIDAPLDKYYKLMREGV
jgi:rhamnulokinase